MRSLLWLNYGLEIFIDSDDATREGHIHGNSERVGAVETAHALLLKNVAETLQCGQAFT